MKSVGYIALAAGAVAAAFLLQSPYMAYIIHAFLLLLGLAYFSSLAWVAGLDCERSIDRATVRQGESVSVELKVHNARGWPIPWLFIEDYHPPECPVTGQDRRLVTLMPGRSITLRYTITFPRRGYHRVGPLLMESGDLFGLQKRFRTGDRQEYVSVLPTIAYIETFNISARRPQGPVRISNRVYQDPTRINSIRDYVPGDPLNSIHWKATARTAALQVKTHEPSTVSGGTLVLDLHEDSYKPEAKEARMELAITTTASIAYLLQMSGEQVGMMTNAADAAEVARYEFQSHQALSRVEVDDAVDTVEHQTKISPLSVPTARTPIQAIKIAENLARVAPGRGLDVVGMLLSESERLPRDAALLLVVPHVSDRLALTLGSLKLAGFNVTVFFMRDNTGYGEAARLLAPHNIHVFHIEEERHLHEIAPQRVGR